MSDKENNKSDLPIDYSSGHKDLFSSVVKEILVNEPVPPKPIQKKKRMKRKISKNGR